MSSEAESQFGSFAPIEDDGSPVRVILVGAGQMGRHWLDVLTASPLVDVVGLVDLDVPLADRALDDLGLDGIATGSSVAAVAAATGAQAVVNVTVPVAHHAVNTEALFAGLPVLCEKPIAPSVAQTLSLIATANVAGQLLMTSQSRRYYRNLAKFRDEVKTLGSVEVVTAEFAKAAHFPGFREEMAHPLLIDMAIHPFDVVRYLLDADPVAVYCETFNPSWSWFSGDAAATAIFELEGRVRYVYTGSWVSAGLETSWNSSWRVSGVDGTALWDGEGAPVVEYGPEGAKSTAGESPVWDGEEIAGALAEFIHALRTGTVPSGDVHSNVLSLAMVEAAVESADGGRRVLIEDVLDAAYVTAIANERRDDVLAELQGWGSARAGLRTVNISAVS
jgi:predicted dehydrogenase